MPGTEAKQPRRESSTLNLPTPDKRRSTVQGKSKPKPQSEVSFFGSLFGSKPPKELPSTPIKKSENGGGGRWFGKSKKRNNVEGAQVSLWGSDLCLFAFMLLSRVSRLNLLMLSERLNVAKGERAAQSFKTVRCFVNTALKYLMDINVFFVFRCHLLTEKI
jgi:hypothetical protein